MLRSVLFWRRIDGEGLERLELEVGADEVRASGCVISLEDGGLRLDHRWRLDAGWRAMDVRVERWNAQGHASMRLERRGRGWEVDGHPRPDLDGAEEPDLSVTPFCNSLPIRRLGEAAGSRLTLDIAYVDGAALTVTRSRQRYERQGPGRMRYVDLGVARGFEADLEVDADGLVLRYEHLFERVLGAD